VLHTSHSPCRWRLYRKNGIKSCLNSPSGGFRTDATLIPPLDSTMSSFLAAGVALERGR